MKKQIYDEKNGMSYTLHGDYYLPDLRSATPTCRLRDSSTIIWRTVSVEKDK